jgi:hypothetical protein
LAADRPVALAARRFQTDPAALFEDLERAFDTRRLPPVANWHPAHSGRIDIRIARDGTWYHEGAPIRRPELVAVFASILRCDADGHVLVTPAERLIIEVDETPFVAIDCTSSGRGRSANLIFTTNVGDPVPADLERPVRMAPTAAGSIPEVTVRSPGGRPLVARILPAVWYRLVELGVEEGGRLLLYSRGARFDLGAIA